MSQAQDMLQTVPTLPRPVRPATARPRPLSRPRRDPLHRATRLAPVLGMALCAALVAWGMQSGVLRSLEGLQTFIGSLGAWGPVVFLALSFATTVFPLIPGGLLVPAAPILFGPVEGTLYSYLAICAGSIVNFAIARQMGLGMIERRFSPAAVEKYLGWTRRPGFARAFAVAIVLPVAPDDLLCYLAGTTKMRWRTYLMIILAGKPWTLLAYGLGVSAVVTELLPW
ncbi:TVP38/TMEM64 family protein [Brachybacterium hainanense]|uniref:TVP38/TMEM64 family membrane protein n=1 Tax=Brachybacterium hainanense TaxID=1541174 RepID=A0ABV6RC46_9MICO